MMIIMGKICNIVFVDYAVYVLAFPPFDFRLCERISSVNESYYRQRKRQTVEYAAGA